MTLRLSKSTRWINFNKFFRRTQNPPFVRELLWALRRELISPRAINRKQRHSPFVRYSAYTFFANSFHRRKLFLLLTMETSNAWTQLQLCSIAKKSTKPRLNIRLIRTLRRCLLCFDLYVNFTFAPLRVVYVNIYLYIYSMFDKN